MNTTLIVGGGRVGAALAAQLTAAGHRTTVIERDPDRVAAVRIAAPAATVIEADGTDPAVLEGAGIRTADVVAAVTGADPTNLVVAALARTEFAVPRTVSRIVDPAHGWLFTPELGVDAAVDQADLLVRLLLDELSLGEVASLIRLRRGDLALVEEPVPAGSRAIGRAIAELGLPPSCVLVAVIRGEQVLPASGGLVLAAGDEVLAVVHAGVSDALAEAFAAT